MQGCTPFGGSISAYAVQAMRDVAGAGWPANVSLRALQTSFIAPIGSGKVDVAVRLLREGKSVRQVQAEVGRTARPVRSCWASSRSNAPQRWPCCGRPGRHRRGRSTPPRCHRCRSRTELHAAFEYAGRRTASVLGRLRIGDQHPHAAAGARSDIVSNEVLTVLLADLTPTPVMGQFKQPTPMSSISWALELRPVEGDPGDGWWRADTDALVVDGGYVNQAGRLWAPDGSLAALAYQVVTVSA